MIWTDVYGEKLSVLVFDFQIILVSKLYNQEQQNILWKRAFFIITKGFTWKWLKVFGWCDVFTLIHSKDFSKVFFICPNCLHFFCFFGSQSPGANWFIAHSTLLITVWSFILHTHLNKRLKLLPGRCPRLFSWKKNNFPWAPELILS